MCLDAEEWSNFRDPNFFHCWNERMASLRTTATSNDIDKDPLVFFDYRRHVRAMDTHRMDDELHYGATVNGDYTLCYAWDPYVIAPAHASPHNMLPAHLKSLLMTIPDRFDCTQGSDLPQATFSVSPVKNSAFEHNTAYGAPFTTVASKRQYHRC